MFKGLAAALLIQLVMAEVTLSSELVYQGQVYHNGLPVTDTADFEFSLWSEATGGTQIDDEIVHEAVKVVAGTFQVSLDFSAAALNGTRWLAIAIRRPTGVGDFVPIPPRQKITSSPYSLQTRGIVVDAAQNVGLGTADPQAKWDVVATSAPGRVESGIRTQVDDAPHDHFQIKNWTNWDEQFFAFLWGHHESDDRNALQFLATTDEASDSGSEAMMVFKAFLSDGVSITGLINNRPLFSWFNLYFHLMTSELLQIKISLPPVQPTLIDRTHL